MSRHACCLFLFLGFGLLTLPAGMAQSLPVAPAEPDPMSAEAGSRSPGAVSDDGLATLQRLQEAETVVTEVMSLAAELGWDCKSCHMDTNITGPKTAVFATMAGKSMDELGRFLALLGKKWTAEMRRMQVRTLLEPTPTGLQLEFDLELHLGPLSGSASGGGFRAEESLGPLLSLPRFDPAQAAAPGARLFGLTCQGNQVTQLQLIAASLDELERLFGSPGLPTRCRSLSRSRVEGTALFNLDLSTLPELPTAREHVMMFRAVEQVLPIRELTVETAPDGSGLVKLDAAVGPGQIPALAEALKRLQLDIWQVRATADEAAMAGSLLTGGSGPKWNLILLLRAGTGEMNVLTEVATLVGAAWPPNLAGGLGVFGTPGYLQVTARVQSEEDVARLKPVAEPLRLAYQGPRTEESLKEQQMVVGFFRQLAAAPSSSGKLSVDVPLGDFMGFGEVIEHSVTRLGPRYVLRVDFSELPRLLDTLDPVKGKGFGEFSLDCTHPKKALVKLTLVNGDSAAARHCHRLARLLITSRLPWNLPRSELAKNYIVEGITVGAGEEFVVTGVTLKSRLVFSDLFPQLQQIPGVVDPFFRRGTYSDTEAGRVMRFEVTAKFRPSEGP